LAVARHRAIEKRDREEVLRLFLTEFGDAVTPDSLPIAFDCCGAIAAGSYSVLKAVANFDPSVIVVRPGRPFPPMKRSPEVA
jgi:hypothetical protein